MSANPLPNSSSFITAYFTTNGNCLQLVQYSDPVQTTLPRGIELSLSEMESFFKDGVVQVDLRNTVLLPQQLAEYTRQLGCERAAYVPIVQKAKLRGFVLIGTRLGQELDEEVVNAFSRTIWLTANSLEVSLSPTEPMNDRRVLERKALDTLASNA